FLAILCLSSSWHGVSHAQERQASLTDLSPEQIAQDVKITFDRRIGTQEYTAPTFDPFENRSDIAGLASLRSVTQTVSIDGQTLQDGAILDLAFFYTQTGDNTHDGIGIESAAFLSGDIAPNILRDSRILECTSDVHSVVYDHSFHRNSGFFHPYGHYYGHIGFAHQSVGYRSGFNRGFSHNSFTFSNLGIGSWRRSSSRFNRDSGFRNRNRNRNYRNRGNRRFDNDQDVRRLGASRAAAKRKNGRVIGQPIKGGRVGVNRQREQNLRRGGSAQTGLRQSQINQNLAGQNLAGQNLTGQNLTGQNPTAQNIVSQDQNRQTRTSRNNVRFNRSNTRRQSDVQVRREQRDENTQNNKTIKPATRVAAQPPKNRTPKNTSTQRRKSTGAEAQSQRKRVKSNKAQFKQTNSKQTKSKQTKSKQIKSKQAKPKQTRSKNSANKKRSNTNTGAKRFKSKSSQSNRPKRFNFFPNDFGQGGHYNGYYGGRSVITSARVDCAREELLSVHIPAERLEAARYDGLTIVAIDRQGQDFPIFIPANYIEGLRLTISGQYDDQLMRFEGRPPLTVPQTQPNQSSNGLISTCPSGTIYDPNNGTCLLIQDGDSNVLAGGPLN
ncbi:MAG: hypothetical protein ABJG88_02650, partial [Litorimonas sp.]